MTDTHTRSRRAVANQAAELITQAKNLLLDLETMETARYEQIVAKRGIDAPSGDRTLALLDHLDDFWTDLNDTEVELRRAYRLNLEGGGA